MAALLPDSPDARKARGAFFTPPEMCDFLAEWGLRSSGDRVLEPSCGEAAFLLAAHTRLRALGADQACVSQLAGVELHEQSAASARAALGAEGAEPDVRVGSFFDQVPTPTFDAVLGNPPYVRYQGFGGEDRRAATEAALAQGVRLSGLSSSWAAFVVHASAFLRPGGRLGLVLPAELLSVTYAAPVRSFLMRRFGSVRLVLFEERVFPGVMEEVVLLLAEGDGPTDRFTVHQLRNLDDLGQVEQLALDWRPDAAEQKWLPALLPADAAQSYGAALTSGMFEHLSSWGSPYLGAVTGNNKYFTLSLQEAQALGLPASELLPISPPGSRHLRGVTFTRQGWNELAGLGAKVFLFRPSTDDLSPGAARKVADGEAAGVQEAYKCRVRSPWWRVPLVAAPDLFFTYMNHDTPRLVRNAAAVHHLNSIHGVRLRHGRQGLGRELLPLAALNSLTMLGAELTGRSYGGGMLKLEPREADLLPVPSPSLIKLCAAELRALQPQLAQSLRSGDLLAAVRRVDAVLLQQGMGLRRTEAAAIREAREALFSRRAARA